ncbi:MAG: type III secretion system export apparatus subunit SctU [Desulfovibrionaceae bacterium]|nr:type III secretion system export apparatus subunit SctU [Desulfovibrionaceae bacterium]
MSDEKTEQPTPKRLRDAREKGQVAKSQDIPSAAAVLSLSLYFLALGPDMARTLLDMTAYPAMVFTQPFDMAVAQIAELEWEGALSLFLPILGVVLILVLSANLAQVGVLFSFEAAKPKLENLSPGAWFKKVFCVKNAFELLKNILKVGILSIAAYSITKDSLRDLFRIPNSNLNSLWHILGEAAIKLLLTTASIFCVIAALDYFFQKWQFTKNNMMSKDEVKREYKENEGDPLIKSKRKEFHQELLRQGAAQNVRKAKVLVVNPTHYAVALDYEKDRTPLPVVLAKGEGPLALQMMEVAKEAGVPIMRNVELARALYNDGTENAYIPKELIGPVAEVLRWVESLKKNG